MSRYLVGTCNVSRPKQHPGPSLPPSTISSKFRNPQHNHNSSHSYVFPDSLPRPGQPCSDDHQRVQRPVTRLACTAEPKHHARADSDVAKLRLLRSGDIHPNPGPSGTLTLATLNVSSLALHIDEVRSLIPADAVAVQETSLTKPQQEEMSRYLAGPCNADRSQWKSLWGAPQPAKRTKHCPLGNMYSGQKGGGIGLLVRKPGVVHALDNSSLSGVPERVLHTMIAVGNGRTFLHCFVVYAPSGNSRAAMAARERLLQSVLFEAQALVGQAPAVILGDLNTDAGRSPTLRHALETTWVDASQFQASRDGSQPQHTYAGTGTAGTRIDYALLNRTAALSLASCSTFDVGSVRGHRCVCVKLSVPAFEQMAPRYSIPRALPPPSVADVTVPPAHIRGCVT